MRNSLWFLVTGILFVAGCSSSTSPGSSGNNNMLTGPVKISTPDNPGDSIWVRSGDEVGFGLRIHATIDTIPTNGVSIVYYDPIFRVNQSFPTGNQGDVSISFGFQVLPKKDTTITYVFRGQYNGTVTDSIKKIFVVLNGEDKPSEPLFHSVDESHIEVRWTRSHGDTYDDSVVVATPVGQQLFIAHNGQSEVTVSGLEIGMVDTISLRTRGGTIAPQQWASVYSTGSKTVRLYDVVGTTDSGATVGLTFDSLGIHPVALKSWDSSQVFLYKQSDGFHLMSSSAITNHQLPPPYPVLTESSWFFGPPVNSSIDTLFSGEPMSVPSSYQYGLPLNMQTNTIWSASGASAVGGPFLYYYFRIEIDPQPNGTLIGTDATGSYIEVKVEYQPLPFGYL